MLSAPRVLGLIVLSLLTLLLALPVVRADDNLDQMMRDMDNKKTRTETVRQAVQQSASAVYNQVSNWLSNVRTPPAQDISEFDDVLEDTNSSSTPGVGSRFWQQAKDFADKAKETFETFPFRHPWWAPSIVGDYLERGLFPAMDRVMNSERTDE